MKYKIVLLVLATAVATVPAQSAPSPGDPITLAIPGRTNATPWAAASGSFAAVAWGASKDGKSDVFVATSRDGGRTFGAPVQVNRVAGEARLGGELPPRIALVRRTASSAPDLIVLWNARGKTTQIKIARSRDGGSSFEPPFALQAPGAAGDRGWPALAIDSRGAPHAIWLDHRGLAAGGSAAGQGSRDGGTHDGYAMAQKSGLFYTQASGRGGRERELAKGVCYCCKTAFAAGADGTLYAAWRHVFPTGVRDIAFTMSRDSGKTFSEPARVSEDGWAINACPDDGPALAVDGEGTVHLIWPTVMAGDKLQGALFYATTRDGRTFTRRARVPALGGPKPSHPQIAIDRGRIVVAWEELIGGRRIGAARTVMHKSGGTVGFGQLIKLAPDGVAIYPVLAPTDQGLLAVWGTGGDSSVIQARILTY